VSQPPTRDRRSAAPRGPRARMFVALDLPAAARSSLVAWRDELISGRRDLRPVRAEALHVTLVFLGWQAEKEADAIAAAAFEACSGLPAPRLRASAVRPIPPRAARLFALDLEDEEGRVEAVQSSMSDALEAGRWYRPEKRPFWPHLTLARAKRGERRPPPLPDTPAPPAEAFEANALTLYRSTLRPQGAVYDPLAQATL
jgi:RNA 2',3'-cyclic 3'-phosphodiesterase